MRLAWLTLPLLVSASAPAKKGDLSEGSGPEAPPVGIKNRSVDCYFLALFQAFLHTPSFASMVLGHHSNDIVHTCLASFFARLLKAPQWGAPVSIETELMPVIEAAIRKEGQHYFQPGMMDDPQAVWIWLLDRHLPWIGESLLAVETHSQLFLGDLPLGNPTVMRADHLQAYVLEAPDKFVDELALCSEEVLNEYKIEPEAYDAATKEALAARKINGITISEEVVKRVTVVKAPPVLAIHVNKFNFDMVEGRPIWKTCPVKYRSSFAFASPQQPPTTYHLHALIAYERPAHFVAYACTDVAKNSWSRLDGQGVQPYQPGAPLRPSEDPYLLLYVEEEHRAVWASPGPATIHLPKLERLKSVSPDSELSPQVRLIRKATEIPPSYGFLGGLFTTLEWGLDMLMGLTRREDPVQRTSDQELSLDEMGEGKNIVVKVAPPARVVNSEGPSN